MISTLSLLLVLINAINGQVHLNRSNLAQLCKYNISSTYIDLSKQKIVSIDANTFQGLSNLKSLNLFSNPLRSIDANAFQGLSNLEKLNLRGHELRSIDANTFQGLSNIKWHPLELYSELVNELDADYWKPIIDTQPVIGLTCGLNVAI